MGIAVSVHLDWFGGKTVSINCSHCTKEGKCTKIPKRFGVFLRDCVYVKDTRQFRCYLKQDSKDKLLKDKVIRY